MQLIGFYFIHNIDVVLYVLSWRIYFSNSDVNYNQILMRLVNRFLFFQSFIYQIIKTENILTWIAILKVYTIHCIGLETFT